MSMTNFLKDILRQPLELQRALDYLSGVGRPGLDEAAVAINHAHHVYVTGIGASWHAALNAGSMFHSGGRPVYLHDAAELLHFATIPPDAAIIILSRSGRSAEIVGLLQKAHASRATVVGVTNASDGCLAREAQFPIVVPVGFDHGISVNTYSSLALAAGALASTTFKSFDPALVAQLMLSVAETIRLIPVWQEQIAESAWFAPTAYPYYFLARGASLGSCYEARLLWEEGAKMPATSMGTGAFRHGPQEIVTPGARFGMWIDATSMRNEDLSVVRDLGRLGASVMLIGQGLSGEAGDLVFRLPEMPRDWQFLIDIIPAQLGAEHISRLAGANCDAFRICSYVVEGEYGLLPERATVPTR